jgi:hypothetical protein
MILKKDEKELFTNWCADNGVEPVSQITFKKRLQEKGIIDYKGTAGKRYWKGIRGRTDQDIENSDSGKVAK